MSYTPLRTQYFFDLSGVKYKSRGDVMRLREQWDIFERVENYNDIVYQRMSNGDRGTLYYQFKDREESSSYRQGQLQHTQRYPWLAPSTFNSISSRPLPTANIAIPTPNINNVARYIQDTGAIPSSEYLEQHADEAIYRHVSSFNSTHKYKYSFTNKEEQLAYNRFAQNILLVNRCNTTTTLATTQITNPALSSITIYATTTIQPTTSTLPSTTNSTTKNTTNPTNATTNPTNATTNATTNSTNATTNATTDATNATTDATNATTNPTNTTTDATNATTDATNATTDATNATTIAPTTIATTIATTNPTTIATTNPTTIAPTIAPTIATTIAPTNPTTIATTIAPTIATTIALTTISQTTIHVTTTTTAAIIPPVPMCGCGDGYVVPGSEEAIDLFIASLFE